MAANCPLISNPDQEDTDNNFIGDACEVPEAGKVGINTDNPHSGLQIDSSDVFINNAQRGLILKNFLGECYRVYIDDMGRLNTSKIQCPN